MTPIPPVTITPELIEKITSEIEKIRPEIDALLLAQTPYATAYFDNPLVVDFAVPLRTPAEDVLPEITRQVEAAIRRALA